MTTLKKYNNVYTTGVFDLLHQGHKNLLETAKSYGNKLIVGVVSDEAVRKFKGKNRPVDKIEKRVKAVKSLPYVDKVVIQKTFDPFISIIMSNDPIDLFIKGSDQSHIDDSYVKKLGIPIVVLPRTEGISTTDIINANNI